MSFFMRVTAKMLPPISAAMATMTVMGWRSAKRMGFIGAILGRRREALDPV